jgi:hypothetical protein
MDASRREPLMRLATHYWKADDKQRAAAYASAALTVPWSGFYANRAEHYAHEPHECLYWALWWLGDREGAARHWEAALRFQPLNAKFQHEARFFIGGPDAETRLGLFRWMIEHGVPFAFVKLGDGEEACLRGDAGATCDGQRYGPELREALAKAFAWLPCAANVAHYRDQASVHVLLHRADIDLAALRRFFGAVRERRERKICVAPERLAPVARMLGAEHVTVPMGNAWARYAETLEQVKGLLEPGAIVLASAGPVAKVLIADLLRLRRDITCLDAGSSFDPLVAQTRTGQATRETMLRLYFEWLEWPSVTVVVPTLRREASLERCIRAVEACDYPAVAIEVVPDRMPPQNQGVPRLVAQGVAGTQSDLVCYLSNDCEPEPDFLKEAVIAWRMAFDDGVGLVALNDGLWHGEFATHWLASRAILPLVGGEFFHTGYYHVGCDNELSARAKRAGRFVWCEGARVHHRHADDEVHRIAWEPWKVEHDRALLRQRAREHGFESTLYLKD